MMWFASDHSSRELRGRGSRPTGVLLRAALRPPTYDIQFLTLPMKSCPETDLYSHRQKITIDSSLNKPWCKYVNTP